MFREKLQEVPEIQTRESACARPSGDMIHSYLRLRMPAPKSCPLEIKRVTLRKSRVGTRNMVMALTFAVGERFDGSHGRNRRTCYAITANIPSTPALIKSSFRPDGLPLDNYVQR